MWTRSSRFHETWLDLETINNRPLVSLSSSDPCDIIWRYQYPICIVMFWSQCVCLSVVTVSLDTTFCLRIFLFPLRLSAKLYVYFITGSTPSPTYYWPWKHKAKRRVIGSRTYSHALIYRLPICIKLHTWTQGLLTIRNVNVGVVISLRSCNSFSIANEKEDCLYFDLNRNKKERV
jgi:hypothetical protein